MENKAADPNPMIALAQIQGQVIGKYVYHVKAKLEWKSNKIEHLKKKGVAVNKENKLLYEKMHEHKDSIQKGEKEKVNLSMELSKTKAKLHLLETLFKPKNLKQREETKQCQIRNLDLKVTSLTKELDEKVKRLTKEISGKDEQTHILTKEITDKEEWVKQLQEGKWKALKLVSKQKRKARKEEGEDLKDLG